MTYRFVCDWTSKTGRSRCRAFKRMEDAGEFAKANGITELSDGDWQILHVRGYGDDFEVVGYVTFNKMSIPEYSEFG